MSATSSDFVPSKLEDLNVTHEELNSIGEALKKEEFRKLLCDYVQEIQNPENRKIYEEELTLLEKQRGVDVTFVTPKACFVIKTSSNGNSKTFINICSNENIGTPSSTKQGGGLNWQVPYVLAPPRLDYDKKHEKCNVYDVVFHPQSIELGSKNKDFKQLLLDTALNGIEQNFKVSLDKVNLKFPNIQFKGSVHPTILRRKSETDSINHEEDIRKDELVQKSYSQDEGSKTEHYTSKTNGHGVENSLHTGIPKKDSLHNGEDAKVTEEHDHKSSEVCDPLKTPLNFPYPPLKENKPIVVTNLDSNGTLKEEYATPNYVVKEYSEVSLDNYRNDMFCKSNVAIPSKLIVEIKLPLLKTMEFTKLNIQGKQFEFESEKPSKYKLNVKLPYTVDDENGNAKFEVDKKLLVVTLPVVYKSEEKDNNDVGKKADSEIRHSESCKNTVEETKSTHQKSTEHVLSALENGSNDEAINETNCSNNLHETESTNQIQANTKHKTESKVQNESSTNYLEVNDNNILNVIPNNERSSGLNKPSGDSNTVLKNEELVVEIKETLLTGFEENSISTDNENEVFDNYSQKNNENTKETTSVDERWKEFFSSKVFYAYPEHLVNASGAQLVFVFHVNTVEKETVRHLLIDETTVLLQFVSVGSGFYRSHYGLSIRLNHPVSLKSISTSQNNVILKLVHTGCLNSCYYVANVQGGEERRICIPEPENFMDAEMGPQVSNQVPSTTPEPSSEQKEKTINREQESVECCKNETQKPIEASHVKTEEPIKSNIINTEEPIKSSKIDELKESNSSERKSTESNFIEKKSSESSSRENIEVTESSSRENIEVTESSSRENIEVTESMSRENIEVTESRSRENIEVTESRSRENIEVTANEDDKENQNTRVESKRMEIPKSKSTSSLSVNGQQYRVRGILKTCSRSLSLSSDEEDDDHYSSSCSVKKHVRFDEHISRKLFSTKCTILEQEKKYQKRLRHLSHKRERRVSETEVSDSETSRKHLSKKQLKKQNRQARKATVSIGGNKNGNIANGNIPETPDCITETSEEESKSSCSCSVTSESGGETSGDSDSGRGFSAEGSVNVLASRKGHRKRGKKNARRVAADAKVDRGVFLMDVN